MQFIIYLHTMHVSITFASVPKIQYICECLHGLIVQYVVGT